MTPEHLPRARELFDSVVNCPPAEADRMLREACGRDAGLYAEVRRMLQEHLGVFSTGQTLAGRYSVVRYISHGGMGEVYEAQDQELTERVALKTLLPEIARDERMIARFKQEIQLSRKIAHPNVCRVFDLARHPADGVSPDVVYFLTMEFLQGETLSSRLDRHGPMSMADSLPLLEQMAQALDAAHRAGVIHRDFKPSNVMLVPPPGAPSTVRAVVTDFGLARSYTPHTDSTVTMTGQVMGTVDYMAPELLAGAQATFASDIYALALVAYKMIAGVLPFGSEAPLAAALRRARQPIPSPKDFSAGLEPRCEHAILRALNPDPAQRFPSAASFVAALRGTSTAITLPLPRMTRPRWVTTAAAAALIAASFLGWRAWRAARTRPSLEAASVYRKGVDDIAAGTYFAATKALTETVRLAPHFALAHARLAEAWVELEAPQKAQEQMLLARREDSSLLASADRLQIEAIDLTITREFLPAVEKYKQLAKQAGDRADLSVDLGRIYEKAGKPDLALESYRRAAEGPEHNPAAWLRLGVLYARRSDVPKSDGAFSQAERLYQLTSNLEGLTEIAFQRGVAADRRNDVGEGAKFLQQALEIARPSGDVPQEIRINLQLATNAYLAGNAELAEKYAREALDASQANKLQIQAIIGLINLGHAYFRKPDYLGAEKYYNSALTLARSEQSARFIALSLVSLAALHDQQQHSEEVIREIKEALPYFQSNQLKEETFSCLVLLGRAELYRGQPQDALASGRGLLEIARVSKNRRQLALAESAIGAAFDDLEAYPDSLEHYLASLDASDSDELVAYADLYVGKAACRVGRCDQSRPRFDEAETRGRKFPPLLVRVAAARAKMALWEGRPGEAVSRARKTLSNPAAQDPALKSDLNTTMGLGLIASGNKAEGLRVSEQSLEEVSKLAAPGSLFDTRVAVMEARFSTGDAAGAMKLFVTIQPELDKHPETRWRVLELASRTDSHYSVPAHQALEQLKQLWGIEYYQSYLKRSDIRVLSRPLL
jgi:tetratricopeptide (TPR) repeat protein